MNKDYLATAEEILKYNAYWWKNTPNEQYKRYDGYEFPTNELTSYTLDEIGDPNIVKLNQYCISLQGQKSTVLGEDTRLNSSSKIESYVYQREYLTIMIPKYEAKEFIEYFNKLCILIIETYDTIMDKLITNIEINEIGKNYLIEHDEISFVWVTATQDENFKNTKFITLLPLETGYYQDLTLVDNIFFRFNTKIIGSLNDFVRIELINPYIGLSDPPIEVMKFKERGGGGILNYLIKPSYLGYKSLIELVIEYFNS